MSGPFDRKYTEDQCEAAALDYIAYGNAKNVARKAAAGELALHGEPVGAFTMPPSTIASYGRKVRLRQAGKAAPAIANMTHRDAVENLRIRFLTIAHEELQAEERKKPGTRDLERIRQAERCALEAARIPGPSDARAPSSGTRDENGKQAPRTTGGKAGALLAEHRRSSTAPEGLDSSARNRVEGAARSSSPRLNGAEDGGPGALTEKREQAAGPLVVAR